jgi:hypothetical protein
MMLQINHRESHDIDIFLLDPQHLPFLDPRTHDFRFEIDPHAVDGDGARALRLVFDGIGEIDFIVARRMTTLAATPTEVEGEAVLLETIPEIIAKKIYYRGASIKPRDIFDIAAAGERCRKVLVMELKAYREHVQRTLAAMEKLNVDFVNRAIAQLAIKDEYREISRTALERAREVLRAV